jgi:hypothetical protein
MVHRLQSTADASMDPARGAISSLPSRAERDIDG